MKFPVEFFGQIELHYFSPRKWIGLSRTIGTKNCDSAASKITGHIMHSYYHMVFNKLIFVLPLSLAKLGETSRVFSRADKSSA